MSWLSRLFAAVTAIPAKLGVESYLNLVTAVRTPVVVGVTWLLAWVTRQANSFPLVQWQNLAPSWPPGISTGRSWLCYFQALSVGPASRVAPFDELSVALVIVSGAFLL